MTVSCLQQLNTLPYFDKETLKSILSGTEEAINKNVVRWLDKGELIQLKRGVYATKTSLLEYKNREGYREYLSNILLAPSYVSLEYVLSLYQIIPEAIISVTAVTLKSGRSFQNELGTFTYKSMKSELFIGYESHQLGSLSYLQATRAKALFDLLYLRSENLEAGPNLIEELRLDLTMFTNKDYKELERYARIAKQKKLLEIIQSVIDYASINS